MPQIVRTLSASKPTEAFSRDSFTGRRLAVIIPFKDGTPAKRVTVLAHLPRATAISR